MTTTILQWHDAAKTLPSKEIDCLLVTKEHDDAVRGHFCERDPFSRWYLQFRGKYPECNVLFWAEIPTAEQVRQKFRDEELKRDGD